jgi:hypothetical protein
LNQLALPGHKRRALRCALLGLLLLGPIGSESQPSKRHVYRAEGSNELCESIVDYYPYGDLRSEFHTPDVPLPEQLRQFTENDFDFFNDGKIDRVFIADFGGHYLLGSLLLVQPGESADRVKVGNDDPLKDPGSWFIPCQLEPGAKAVSECPPFSQANDEAGLTVVNRNGTKTVRFRGRFTDLTPLRVDGTTYLVLRAVSEGAGELNYSALIQPQRGRKFRVLCMLYNDHPI